MAKIRGIPVSVWELFDKNRKLLNLSAPDYLYHLMTVKPIVTAPTTIVTIDDTQLKFKDQQINDLKAQLVEAAATIAKLNKKIKKLAEE